MISPDILRSSLLLNLFRFHFHFPNNFFFSIYLRHIGNDLSRTG